VCNRRPSDCCRVLWYKAVYSDAGSAMKHAVMVAACID
jgi:hypothetical protein